jgi:hypothetical protein
MLSNATIIHHQGFGDLFTNNAICMYYAQMFKTLTVFASSESRLRVIQEMYKDVPNIMCKIPDITNKYDGKSACLNCMTIGNPFSCPRDNTKCLYVDYTNYNNFENIKIGCFNDTVRWEEFLSKEIIKGSSFSHAFYDYHKIPLLFRTNSFYISREILSESENYNYVCSTIGSEYIVVHDDISRGYNINMINKNFPTYYINGKSNNMINQISILENAKEIHFIDSSYSVLVYFLSFVNEKIKNKPKFLHLLNRNDRDTKIYTNPTPENWSII